MYIIRFGFSQGYIETSSLAQAIEIILAYAFHGSAQDYAQVTKNDKFVLMIDRDGAQYLRTRHTEGGL